MEADIKTSAEQERFKSFLIISITQAVAFISNFINIYILTRIFPPEEYAIYQFSLTFLSIFTIFANFGLSTTLIQQLSAEKGKDSGKIVPLISEGFKLIFLFTILFSLILLFLSDLFEQLYQIPDLSITLKFTALFLFSLNLTNYFESIFQGLWNFKYFAISFSIAKTGKTIIVLLSVIVRMPIYNIVALFSVISLIQFVIVMIFVQKKYSFLTSITKTEVKITKRLLKFSVFIFFYVFFQNIITNSNQFILAFFIEPDELAYYTILLWIMTSLSILAIIFSRFVLPYVSHYFQIEGEERKNVDRIYNLIFKYGLLITIPVSFYIFYFSDYLIVIIFSSGYYPISAYLKFFVFYLNILMIDIAGGHFLWASNEPKLVYKLYGTTLISTIIMSLILIPIYHTYGALLSFVIPHTIYVIYSIILVKRKNAINLESNLILTLLKYVLSAVILIICFNLISLIIKLDFTNLIILFIFTGIYFGSFLILNVFLKAIRIADIKEFINIFKRSVL